VDENLRESGDGGQGDVSVESSQQEIPVKLVDDSKDATREAAKRLFEKRSNCVGVCAVGII
jgi:hypothetical protein